MIRRLLCAFGILLLAACRATAPAGAGAPELRAVERVDLARYAGTWHEIARTPFAIQDRCARDTTATYAPLGADRIAVTNRCVLPDGREFGVDGVAWVIDRASNARLKVSFLPAWLRWLPIGRGDYWIIDLATDYGWVVIGEPRRRYLWILARSPTLPAATYRDIMDRLPAQGYDPDRIRPSPGR